MLIKVIVGFHGLAQAWSKLKCFCSLLIYDEWSKFSELTIEFSVDSYDLFYSWWFYDYLNAKLGNLFTIGS